MKALITGVAGFIGSHVAKYFLENKVEVVGIDCLLADLYSSQTKSQRVTQLQDDPNFTFVLGNLVTLDLDELVSECSVIVHEAALPGLLLSWDAFEAYNESNVLATERLLKAMLANPEAHLVHASTSSVYGLNAIGDENSDLAPISPYGVTKLAAENLIHAYATAFGLQATILRYFSVYGPSQRPDMAYAKFCNCLIAGSPIVVTGDGRQSRTNTHVDDVARATYLAAQARPSGEVLNICGDEEIELLEVIRILADEIGVVPEVDFRDSRLGDQYRTRGDATKARHLLGWSPATPIDLGLRLQARRALNDWEAQSL